MAIAKLRGWEILLIRSVGIPILMKVMEIAKKKAAETPTELDDALVGALEVVISFLQSPDMFEET